MSNDTSTCLKTKGLDLKAAVFLAEASAEAYSRDPETTKDWAAERGFTSCQSFDLGNIQGFWTEGDDVAMLSFRGTSNIGQWVRDARILPAGHAWGLVHRGFKKGVDIVHGYVDAFAAVAATKPYVWITGHSLGGALAVIAAANLKLKGINASTYTYGQPRAGYINFADNFDRKLSGRLYRFINQMDIVARLPPGLLFKHCGIPKRIVRPGVLESVEAMLNAELPVEAYEMPDLLYQPERRPVLLEHLEEAEMLGRPQMIDSDLPALTEREFLQLQLQLGVASEGYEEGIEFEGSVHSQGLFGDHAIVNYINLLREIRDQA